MGAPASSPTRSVWEIPLSPLPTVFPRMTATMTEATTIRPAMARPSLFARLFGRKSKTEDDKTLDKYAADDPFDRAASQHGATAETPVVDPMTGEIIGARTIASSSYDGRPHLSSPVPAADADDGDASRTRVITSGPDRRHARVGER